jgi:rare lipoprotein A
MRCFRFLAIALISIGTSAFAAPPATSPPLPATAPAASASSAETGLAVVYSDRRNGPKTASGTIYRRTELTAAHKTLPFGTRVKVTNTSTGRSVVLTITDRGPREADRIIDISPAAAQQIGIPRNGIGQVKLEVVSGT